MSSAQQLRSIATTMTGPELAAAAKQTAQQAGSATVKKFFEGTQASGPVYGFRIDNDGEADVKLMGISANTFLDNPENPQLIPEPSAFLITALAGLAIVLPRRRNRFDLTTRFVLMSKISVKPPWLPHIRLLPSCVNAIASMEDEVLSFIEMGLALRESQ